MTHQEITIAVPEWMYETAQYSAAVRPADKYANTLTETACDLLSGTLERYGCSPVEIEVGVMVQPDAVDAMGLFARVVVDSDRDLIFIKLSFEEVA